MRKILAFSLICVMIAGILLGCSKKSVDSASGSAAPSATGSTQSKMPDIIDTTSYPESSVNKPSIDGEVWKVPLEDFDKANNNAFIPGDKIAFIGDSITHHMAGTSYYSLFMAYMATRYPFRKIEAYNFGRSGEGISGTNIRYPYDMQELSFNKAFILMGMNNRSTQPASFEVEYKKLLDTLKGGNIYVNLLSTTIYDDKLVNPSIAANEDSASALMSLNQVIKNLAAERGLGFVNLYKSMLDCNQIKLSKTPGEGIIMGDRVHPTAEGHVVMFYNLVRNLNLSGEVATVEIDYGKGSLIRKSNADVTNLKTGNNTVSYQYRAHSLPMPITQDYLAVKADGMFDIDSFMNREIIKVKGLEAGDYIVKAKGIALGAYTADQLSAGINIAFNAKSPNQQKASSVNTTVKLISGKETLIRDIKFAEYDAITKGKKTTISERIGWLQSNKVNVSEGTQKFYDEYIKNIERLDEHREELLSLREKLYEENKADEFEITIVKK